MDLAAERLGGAVLLANDEFFAPKEALLKPGPAEWREHEYTERGKWMDGWETRRRRDPGYDWCIVRLGLPGVVRGLVVDTAFFRGNYPESCSVEGCDVSGSPDPQQIADDAEWFEILPQSAAGGEHREPVSGDGRPPRHAPAAEHLPGRRRGAAARARLGASARGRGSRCRAARWTWRRWRTADGCRRAATCSTATGRTSSFPAARASCATDGRRAAGAARATTGASSAWARPDAIHRIELDTDFFMGNAPGRASLEGIHAPGADDRAS